MYKPVKKSVFVRSPLSQWMGGKFYLANRIVPLIPVHQCYCEPFFGAGWVLFKKPESPIEVANDVNGALIECWKTLRDRPGDLQELVNWSLVSRAEFEALVCMTPCEVAAMDEVERAWRLLYILKNSFGGRNVGHVAAGWQGGAKPTFGYKKTGKYFYGGKTLGHKAHCHLFQLEYPELVGRVRRIRFECLDYAEVLERYDHANTFFYLDPPYFGSGDYYGGDFTEEDHKRLAGLLAALAGKFILSVNDCPEAREIYGGFRLHMVESVYTLATNSLVKAQRKKKRHGELLISNYDFDGAMAGRYNVERI